MISRQSQRAVYEWLADHFGRPIPPVSPRDFARKRGWTNKRVSNTRLRALGWVPRYPSFTVAIDQDPEMLAALSIPRPESTTNDQ